MSQKITTANLVALIKALIFGFLSAETLYLAKALSSRINEYINSRNHEYGAIAISAAGILLVVVYMMGRGFSSRAMMILKSNRLDILIAICFGIIISVSYGGAGTDLYTRIASALAIRQLLLLVSLPLVVGLLLQLRLIQEWKATKTVSGSPFFISDVERKSQKDDLLDFSDKAERFAQRVYNQGSTDSIVFGIDAPWGIGKSTFINFCKEHWEMNYGGSVIIYSFNPLKYEDRENLQEKFVDGLICAIQKNSFVPEIKPLISKYTRFIKGAKGTFSGFGFEILPGSYTIEDAFESLHEALSVFDKKVVVVVDDLDRLNFSAIKDVLFAIKQSFTLPNISYVLCYDTENINVFKEARADIEKVTEFLEKFVNVKISLYLDSIVLIKYVTENIAKVLIGNSQAKPILVSKAVAGLKEIYNSQDYHHYLPFIGDIRKLKRLINTLLLLEIEKTDFDNSDFNNHDLIHLLLIYINYPGIFRKIFNTETAGKKGFFSALGPYDDGYPEDPSGNNSLSARSKTYKNSKEYASYVGQLLPAQKLLLKNVFEVTTRLSNLTVERVPEDVRRSYACFNGAYGSGKNLEEYLNLIVKLSKPQIDSQHRFYLNCKNEVVQGRPVEDILSKKEFLNNEGNHRSFWRVILNSSRELQPSTAEDVINYLLNNVQNYSLVIDSELSWSLRNDINYTLVKLLDTVGWSDPGGKHFNNTDENVMEIAEWVFGEGRHKNRGVIAKLTSVDRGILGLHDLLAFRLYCCADRGGDIYNLQRALTAHGNPNASNSGALDKIAIAEMREISQATFKIFKDQYINKRVNIFELVDGLMLRDLVGKYREPIKVISAMGETIDPVAHVSALRSRIKTFIVYQLGTSLVGSGVGCGYYNEAGIDDKQEIKTAINDYLFNECFNLENSANNLEHFIDYLLINLEPFFGFDGQNIFTPSVNEFTKVLERERLANYWKKNRKTIRTKNLTEKDKIVYGGNINVSYKRYLGQIFITLDNLVQDVDSGGTHSSGLEDPLLGI